jgi:hypothetical protein
LIFFYFRRFKRFCADFLLADDDDAASLLEEVSVTPCCYLPVFGLIFLLQNKKILHPVFHKELVSETNKERERKKIAETNEDKMKKVLDVIAQTFS